MSEELLKKLALAKKKQHAQALRLAYNPADINSRPTPDQQMALLDLGTYPVQDVRGGNQCLAKGTLVMTPGGPVPIEDMRPGDVVYSEHGQEIKVLQVFHNGPKEVSDLVSSGPEGLVVSCTREHRWLLDSGEVVQSSDLRGRICRANPTQELPSVEMRYGNNPRVEDTYDIHVDSPTNLYLLANGLVTHNSGKSQYGARNIAYFCERNHPSVDIDTLWPNQPMLCLVLARTSTHYEEHWEKRIKPFFEPGTYKEAKVGGVLKTVRFRNGSKIIFFSYENPYEAAERVQSFTGHLIWIDEICSHLPLYEEAERRIQANGGRMIITYTPKKPVPTVRRYIEAASPYKKSYVFDAFDNPIYDEEKKARIEASINQLPAAEREKWYATIRYGAWMESSETVYAYDSDLHGADLPDYYSPLIWRHMEVVDPAASGLCGLLVAAEDPQRGQWYLVKAKYLNGEAPSDLLDKIESETSGINITHRTADPNAVWFIKEAAKRKRYYGTLIKDSRKEELIKNVSEALKEGWLKVVEDECEPLTDEMGTAKWSTKNPGKIQNSTRYHLLDCLQYFVDTKPKFQPRPETTDVLVLLDLANRKRKKNEAKRKKKTLRLRPAFRVGRR